MKNTPTDSSSSNKRPWVKGWCAGTGGCGVEERGQGVNCVKAPQEQWRREVAVSARWFQFFSSDEWKPKAERRETERQRERQRETDEPAKINDTLVHR